MHVGAFSFQSQRADGFQLAEIKRSLKQNTLGIRTRLPVSRVLFCQQDAGSTLA